jgi:DNA repair exonuclease SbcCD ATPase subunit
MLSKKEGVRERDRLINELEDLQKRVQTQAKYIEEMEEKRAEDEEKIKDLYRQLEDVSNDAFKGKRSLEQITNKLQETSDEKQFIGEELKKFKQQVRFDIHALVDTRHDGTFHFFLASSRSAKSSIESSFSRTSRCSDCEQTWTSKRLKIISTT